MKYKAMFLPAVVAAVGTAFSNLAWSQEFKPNRRSRRLFTPARAAARICLLARSPKCCRKKN